MKKVKVGVIGCGNISGIYLKNMTTMFDVLEVKAVCDLIKPRSQYASETYGVPVIYDTDEEMYADPEIEIIGPPGR